MVAVIVDSSSSSSTSASIIIIIIIIIISSNSINNKSVLLTISGSIFELFIYFLLLYISIPQQNFFKGPQWKLQQHNIFVSSLPSHLMDKIFTVVSHFNEFIFVYVVNISFIFEDEIHLLNYLFTYQKYQEIENTALCFVFEGFGNLSTCLIYKIYYQNFKSWNLNKNSCINAGRKVVG